MYRDLEHYIILQYLYVHIYKSRVHDTRHTQQYLDIYTYIVYICVGEYYNMCYTRIKCSENRLQSE